MNHVTKYLGGLVVVLIASLGGWVHAASEEDVLLARLSQAPGAALKALRVTYAPGQSTPAHRHGADAFVYVLSGHIRSQVEGGPVQVYGPGESWLEPAGAHHLVSGNASTTTSATMLVVFIGPAGSFTTAMDRPSQPAERTQSR